MTKTKNDSIITYNDYMKLNLRIGKIIEFEEVKKSKKLLCCKVRIGNRTRQILSGIKGYYEMDELVGKQVLVLENIQPATMAGMQSEGVILSAEDSEGNLALLVPDKNVDTGDEVY
ncbi:methionine--tRNA ligase subunit beta [Lachnotalea glycerini]|nr:methionine--tRNA ligase subunit beta [Lachnotalea glycerini]